MTSSSPSPPAATTRPATKTTGNSLRELRRNTAFAEPMTDAIGQFQRWQADLTDEEREECLREAREQLGRPRDSER